MVLPAKVADAKDAIVEFVENHPSLKADEPGDILQALYDFAIKWNKKHKAAINLVRDIGASDEEFDDDAPVSLFGTSRVKKMKPSKEEEPVKEEKPVKVKPPKDDELSQLKKQVKQQAQQFKELAASLLEVRDLLKKPKEEKPEEEEDKRDKEE